MTTRAKILGGFIVIFVFGLILGIIGLVSTSWLTTLSNEQYQLQEAGASISSVTNAHNSWRQQLTESVLIGTEFKGSLDPENCAFGKWTRTEEAQSITDPNILDLLKQVEDPHSYIHMRAGDIVNLINAGDMEGALHILEKDIFPQVDKTVSLLTNVESGYNVLLEEKGSEIVDLGSRMMTITIVLLAVMVVACVLFAWKITSSIMRPIRQITQVAETISTGDLDVHIEYAVNDEIGKLAKAFQSIVDSTFEQVSVSKALANGDLTVEIAPRGEKDAMGHSLKKTVAGLNDMFEELANSTVQVANGAKQIADGGQSLAQGSAEQASVVEQLSAAISEISEKTNKNADMAKEAEKLSSVIKVNAENGNHQMERMMQAVKEINDASNSIGKVIKVIDDIAFQTNILALNAAVEAARAGQHGKGFAVVADEVRNLAQKSAEAAKDTGSLIENSIEKANLGLDIATETATSLQDIVSGINHSAEIITQISNSSDNQAASIIQIESGIEEVAKVVQQNSATAEESAAASEEMSSQATLLQGLVSQFRLKKSSDFGNITASSQASREGTPDTAFALSYQRSIISEAV